MRVIRTMMAVLFVLALGQGSQAHAQYGLYGAPSTLPLSPTQPAPSSTIPQSAPLYADTNAMTGAMGAEPVVVNSAPLYGNQAYGNQAYGNQAYGNQAYGNQAYGNQAYGNQAYAGPARTYGEYAPRAYPAPPQATPRVSQVPFAAPRRMPVVPVSVYQGGVNPALQPSPDPVVPQPGVPGSVSQMLDGNGYGQPSAYTQGAACTAAAGCGMACESSCQPTCDPCAPCCPMWFGSVAALYMTRNEPNRLWTSYETGNNPNQLPTDARTNWAVGGEVTIGRLFCCETCDPCDPCCDPYGCSGSACGVACGTAPAWQFGIEATYWGLDSLDGYSTQVISGGSVSTPLIVSDIEFSGVNGTVYFDGAAEHTVRRKDEIHNVEVNFLSAASAARAGYGSLGSVGEPFSMGWALGVRYFRFEENFLFGSLDSGHTWGESGGLYEAYLEDNVRNSLLGFQFGADLSYNWLPNWRIFAAPKIGLYNNHVEHYFSLQRGDGVVANPTAASGVTDSFPVRSNEDALSFLSEIDLGLDWQVAPNWSVFLGYRVVFATGIALADNQIPTYVVDIPEIADIDTNGDLVLHGGFAGVTLRY